VSDGQIVLDAQLLTDAPSVADEFRKRSYRELGLAFDIEEMPKKQGEPIRFYGWRDGLAIHRLFNRLSAERVGQPIKRNAKFFVSFQELSQMGEKCRIVLDAYEVSERKGDRTGALLVPQPSITTLIGSGYRYDPSSYRNEIRRAVRLVDILSGIPSAKAAGYYYSWFTWI
jgi:hypothetical protein